MKVKKPLPAADRDLGLASSISRRDFINGAMATIGCAALEADTAAAASTPANPSGAAFDGPGGVGDYAISNGNVWSVVSAAHRIRDGAYRAKRLKTNSSVEECDFVVIGGGASGIGAAYEFSKRASASKTCLVLDNHPMFGGEAKGNELIVDGVRLMGPQGSNMFFTPSKPADGYLFDELTDIGMPLRYPYAEAVGTSQKLDFDRTNYAYLLITDESDSIGYFNNQNGSFVRNPWQKQLNGCGLPRVTQQDLLRWKYASHAPALAEQRSDAYLDGITYEDYLTKTLGLDVSVARFCDPLIASAVGLGSGTCSALAAKLSDMHGFDAAPGDASSKDSSSTGTGRTGSQKPGFALADVFKPQSGFMEINCFPQGNGYVARYFVKHLIPDSITGGKNPGDVCNGRVRHDKLDVAGSRIRIRLSSTVVRVEQTDGRSVTITYERGGQLYQVRAKAAVVATGAWVSKHIVKDLPADHLAALQRFKHAPFLVANVGLRNWRALDRLGVTSCRWFDGQFGFSCNIRNPIQLPGYQPPLNPNAPVMLTFYAPILHPGLSAEAQGALGRAELFSTGFADFERRIRQQLATLFGRGGFDPARDIGGIVLNRWGHAYVVPEPGFLRGTQGQPCPSDVVRQPVDRIAFAHAELRGLQNFRGAVFEAQRAVRQVIGFI